MAVAARAVAGSIGLGIDTALALGFGLAAGTVPSVRSVILPGARFAARQLLRIGVALLGARLTIDAVVEGGAAAI
ncbi:MAG: putative sulfate exporter family transporter, partial [Chloroflexota bacterium]